MCLTISDKIKSSLSEYLEFDSGELFIPDLTRVFGGAIRDIIADMTIHDVDIICASRSAKRLESLLISKGYNYLSGLNPKDLSSVYTDIKIICEPRTYINGTKIVQIIKPSGGKGTHDFTNYSASINRLVSNVDLTCCGVSFDGDILSENIKDAILHCRNRVYSINVGSMMSHPNRLSHRMAKLENRGWEEIKTGGVSNRDIKIKEILKPESYSDGYYKHVIGW